MVPHNAFPNQPEHPPTFEVFLEFLEITIKGEPSSVQTVLYASADFLVWFSE
jgi:hypothetical protein